MDMLGWISRAAEELDPQRGRERARFTPYMQSGGPVASESPTRDPLAGLSTDISKISYVSPSEPAELPRNAMTDPSALRISESDSTKRLQEELHTLQQHRTKLGDAVRQSDRLISTLQDDIMTKERTLRDMQRRNAALRSTVSNLVAALSPLVNTNVDEASTKSAAPASLDASTVASLRATSGRATQTAGASVHGRTSPYSRGVTESSQAVDEMIRSTQRGLRTGFAHQEDDTTSLYSRLNISDSHADRGETLHAADTQPPPPPSPPSPRGDKTVGALPGDDKHSETLSMLDQLISRLQEDEATQ